MGNNLMGHEDFHTIMKATNRNEQAKVYYTAYLSFFGKKTVVDVDFYEAGDAFRPTRAGNPGGWQVNRSGVLYTPENPDMRIRRIFSRDSGIVSIMKEIQRTISAYVEDAQILWEGFHRNDI